MSDELTRNDAEEPVCDCPRHAWVCRTSGWYCCHCGKWQCSISGRVSIRDPEPFQFHNPIARRRASNLSNPFGPAEEAIISYDLSEVELALFEALTNDWEPDPDSDG